MEGISNEESSHYKYYNTGYLLVNKLKVKNIEYNLIL